MNIGMYGFKQKQIFKQLVKLLIGTLKEYPYSSVKLVETTWRKQRKLSHDFYQ